MLIWTTTGVLPLEALDDNLLDIHLEQACSSLGECASGEKSEADRTRADRRMVGISISWSLARSFEGIWWIRAPSAASFEFWWFAVATREFALRVIDEAWPASAAASIYTWRLLFPVIFMINHGKLLLLTNNSTVNLASIFKIILPNLCIVQFSLLILCYHGQVRYHFRIPTAKSPTSSLSD